MNVETILVTGGAGAIGSRLVADLCRDHKVLVLDDLSSGWFDNLRGLPVSFWRGSVTDEEILREVFAEKPSVVFHLAANFANQNSVDYPQKDLLVNGLGTLKVLEFSTADRRQTFHLYIFFMCLWQYGSSDQRGHGRLSISIHLMPSASWPGNTMRSSSTSFMVCRQLFSAFSIPMDRVSIRESTEMLSPISSTVPLTISLGSYWNR